MTRSKTLIWAAAGAVTFALLGCAGGRKAAGEPPSADAIRARSDSAAADSALSGRRDSVAKLDAHLAQLDTSQVPAQYASQLYLLTLDNFLAMAPDDARVPEVRLWKANHLYNQHEYAQAIEEYQTLIENYPGSPQLAEANQMIAQAFEHQGDHEKAEAWYRRMLSDTEESVRHQAEERIAQAIYLQGDAEEKAGHFRKAAENYARVVKEFPKADIGPIALFNAGVMAERLQDWSGAIAYYNHFFDLYYASDVLPKVLFREAKCRELNGEFKLAGEKYNNLAQAHPQSKEAEPALYNAGFAFGSAKLPEQAARAFETYAERFPDLPEAPNLLSRAVEAYGTLKAWDKVAELQSLFSRRYGGNKGRLVQALSMGGLSEAQQGHETEARNLSQKALSEFDQIKSPDATVRFYAAQARQTLGDLEAGRMRASPLRAGALDADLKTKRALLRSAAEQYLGAMELKIVDGVVRAGFGMAEAFRTYGEQASAALLQPGKNPVDNANKQEEALSELFSAYAQAAQQYARVLQIARKQNINNRQVEDARAGLLAIMANSLGRLDVLDSAWQAAYPFQQGSVEEALSLRLTRAQRSYQSHQRVWEWMGPLYPRASEFGLDSSRSDSLGISMLKQFLAEGRMFQDVVDTARSAPIPAAYDSIQAFFYLAKLLQELLPSVEARAVDVFSAGIHLADSSALKHGPAAEALRDAMGQSLFAQAHALDFLANRALGHPPIPAGLPPAQKKTYEKKFEEMGYALRDQSVKIHRALVDSATRGVAAADWAARSFAVLLRVEPDRWQSAGRDTVFTLESGPQWQARWADSSGWPAKSDAGWKKVKAMPPPYGDSLAAKAAPAQAWIGLTLPPPLKPNADTVHFPKMRFAAGLPWDADPDSVAVEIAASGFARVWIGEDSLISLPGKKDTAVGSLRVTLTPHAGTLPPLEWKKGKRVGVEVKVPRAGTSASLLLRVRAFGRIGAGEILFPWNRLPASEAALDSLRNLRFAQPNFGP